jgi:hypothetical protein
VKTSDYGSRMMISLPLSYWSPGESYMTPSCMATYFFTAIQITVKGKIQRNLIGDEYRLRRWIFIGRWGTGYFISFYRDTIMDSVENFMPQVRPEISKMNANIRRCCKPHVAPFNLFFISINQSGLCYQCENYLVPLAILLIGTAN